MTEGTALAIACACEKGLWIIGGLSWGAVALAILSGGSWEALEAALPASLCTIGFVVAYRELRRSAVPVWVFWLTDILCVAAIVAWLHGLQ
jgi:hypothetical protein